MAAFTSPQSNGREIEMILSMSRKIQFSSSHRYQLEDLSEIENKKKFGACFTNESHGHNYTFEATVAGELDASSGLIMNLTELDELMKECCSDFDHNHLNSTRSFQKQLSSTENLAQVLFYRLKEKLDARNKKGSTSEVSLLEVKIFETADLWSTYSAK